MRSIAKSTMKIWKIRLQSLYNMFIAGGCGACIEVLDLQHGQDENKTAQRRRRSGRRRQVDGRPYPRLIADLLNWFLRIFPINQLILNSNIPVYLPRRLECTDLKIHPLADDISRLIDWQIKISWLIIDWQIIIS